MILKIAWSHEGEQRQSSFLDGHARHSSTSTARRSASRGLLQARSSAATSNRYPLGLLDEKSVVRNNTSSNSPAKFRSGCFIASASMLDCSNRAYGVSGDRSRSTASTFSEQSHGSVGSRAMFIDVA
jgi:hypothetical protein